jgi:hypothetical protein
MDEIYNQLLQIPNVIVIIRLYGTYDLHISVALEDFNKMFEISERSSKINVLEKPNVLVTPMLPDGHLTCSLLCWKRRACQNTGWAK